MPARHRAARDAPGLCIFGHVTRLTWQPALSLHLMHPRAPEADAPVAASSLVRYAARRRTAAPWTWPARTAVAGRRTLLAWTWTTGGQTHTRNHQPRGVAPRRPAPAGVFSVVGTLLSTSLAAGVDLRTVQEMLGHSSIVLTADTEGTITEDTRASPAGTARPAGLNAARLGYPRRRTWKVPRELVTAAPRWPQSGPIQDQR